MWKYYVMRLAYTVLGRLPLRVLYGIAHIVADGAYTLRRRMRGNVIANMRQVMGPEASDQAVRRAAREVFRNATRYYADMFHVPHMDKQSFMKHSLQIDGLEHLAAAQDAGRGAVVASAHFGNPEMAVQGLSGKDFQFYALTEPLQPEQLSEFTHWLRSHHGHEYRTVGFGAIKEAIRRLKNGGLVAILIDRDVNGTGVPMMFCGAEARIPLGAVELALRTGADLIPCWTWRAPGYTFRARVDPPLELIRTGDFDADARANTRRLLALFECELRKDPGQWAVLERIWRE
jgi:KDO2-lipid IV(A) lauroyltransferase